MRRSFNYGGHSTGSNVGTVEVGETHVKVLSPGSSTPVTAKILGRVTDEQGRLTSIVLDSLVHEKYRTNFGEFEAWGVHVTEFHVKERMLDEKEEDEESDDE